MIGVQVFDTDPDRPLLEKVRAAMEAYQQKCGHAPEVCLVNPDQAVDMTEEQLAELSQEAGVTVRPAAYCLKGYLWPGVDSIEAMNALELDA